MAQENDEVQQNGNSNSSDDAMTAMATASSAGVNTDHGSGATTTTAAIEGDEALAKDKVNSGGASDLNGGGGGGGGDCDGFGAADGKAASCLRGKLNDLVADLRCTSDYGGATVTVVDGGCGGGIGDYTNIRATSGPTVYAEGSPSQFNKAAEPTWDSTQTPPPTHVQAPPTQNSSFSFKHFLNSSTTLTAPSSTVTSLDSSSAASGPSSSATNPLQTSTGARPKVPQSASLSATSISSLTAGTAAGSGGLTASGGSGSSATKMKRSPKFSSFDSQASLAEYAAVGAESELDCTSSARLSSGGGGNGGGGSSGGGAGSGTSNGFRLYLALRGESSDFFDSRISSNLNTGSSSVSTNPNDFERQYVPRSYSNYDMPMPPTASPRRRAAVVSGGGGNCSNSGTASGTKEARPTRLALHTNSSKLKLDLPLEDVSNSSASTTAARPSNSNNTASDFPAAPSAALPDFVQDHWMDSWYAHDNLNSPPNSPIRDFGDEVAGGRAPGNSDNGLGGGGVGANVMGAAASSNSEPSGNSKMLPDFLSDGPIIHSSQRLADVAVGLPSNSIGSPDDPPITSQLSRLRIENERLQRELSDARASFSEQSRRVSELERQLQEVQRSEAAGSYKQGEEMDKSKKRTAAAQSHVVKLKHQVIQLTAEVETLRRENEVLREEGAVGGCSVPSCERTRSYATEAAAGGAGGVRGNASRPSRTQQISRDLRRAASNAENNLRQLLAGVDNLRQMAADIETSELRLDYDVSPDLFSDFLDDCDAYEEYPGGHAL